MKQVTSPQISSFKDLYISSYLKAKGFPLYNADLDLDPSTLSKIIIGCIEVTKDDPRLQRVCKVIDFPVENAIDGCPNSGDKEEGEVEL